jgi:phosphoribosylformylglycinamidine (FGAM) synthase PurS component
MCKKLLANPVLEDYTIESDETPNLAATSAVR